MYEYTYNLYNNNITNIIYITFYGVPSRNLIINRDYAIGNDFFIFFVPCNKPLRGLCDGIYFNFLFRLFIIF